MLHALFKGVRVDAAQVANWKDNRNGPFACCKCKEPVQVVRFAAWKREAAYFRHMPTTCTGGK